MKEGTTQYHTLLCYLIQYPTEELKCTHKARKGQDVLTNNFVQFGGLVVSMLASGTQDRGFDPGRSRRIFRAKKIHSMPSLGGK